VLTVFDPNDLGSDDSELNLALCQGLANHVLFVVLESVLGRSRFRVRKTRSRRRTSFVPIICLEFLAVRPHLDNLALDFGRRPNSEDALRGVAVRPLVVVLKLDLRNIVP
jgi:hypothetical protein